MLCPALPSCLALLAVACGGMEMPRAPDASAPVDAGSPGCGTSAARPAFLQPFAEGTDAPTNNSEILHLTPHRGRLYAATGQWMSTTQDGAQILVRASADAPWSVFTRFAQVRNTVLESYALPLADGGSAEILVTVGRDGLDEPQRLRWLRDDEAAFRDVRGASNVDLGDVRSLGLHETPDGPRLFVGSARVGLVSVAWDPDAGELVADAATPELQLEGQGTEVKVTGFERCGGRLFATVENELYVRDDAAGDPRWRPYFVAPEVSDANSGLRGLTCVDGAALLVSLEGPGTVVRFDDLDAAEGVPAVELEPRELVAERLRAWGHDVPADGRGSVGYIIAAYNEWLRLDDGRLLTGIEWAYQGASACPATRRCLPERDFDAAACLLLRAPGATWSLECLGGALDGVQGPPVTAPVTYGEAFVAPRTMRVSPFDPARLVVAGYDANFVPADGRAWIGALELACLGAP